jgi:hypothetical protein
MDKYRRLVTVANKHYKKDNGFCTVIATAIAMGCSFGAARSRLYHLVGRRDGNGIQRHHHISAMEMMGYKMTLVTNQFQSKTLVTIQREMKKTTGTYFVYTRQHVTTIQDGVCEDWSHNAIQPARYKVQCIYQVVDANDSLFERKR